MIDRRMLPWLLGLAALTLGSGALAVVLMWWSSDLQSQVNAFYSAVTGSEQLSDEVYRHWDTLSRAAYTAQAFCPPLLTGCAATLFALPAVLARRWDVTHRRALPPESPAAA